MKTTSTFNETELFDFIDNKRDKIDKYNEERKEQWDRHRIKCKHFIDTTKVFFEKVGIKVEFVLDTDFDLKEASRGFYPYLRIQRLLLCFTPYEEGMIQKNGGKFTYNEFIKKYILN